VKQEGRRKSFEALRNGPAEGMSAAPPVFHSRGLAVDKSCAAIELVPTGCKLCGARVTRPSFRSVLLHDFRQGPVTFESPNFREKIDSVTQETSTNGSARPRGVRII
jgi:hypothetical protein